VIAPSLAEIRDLVEEVLAIEQGNIQRERKK
jgi:hypothetical protein